MLNIDKYITIIIEKRYIIKDLTFKIINRKIDKTKKQSLDKLENSLKS